VTLRKLCNTLDPICTHTIRRADRAESENVFIDFDRTLVCLSLELSATDHISTCQSRPVSEEWELVRLQNG
jgi:hypothetical protein